MFFFFYQIPLTKWYSSHSPDTANSNDIDTISLPMHAQLCYMPDPEYVEASNNNFGYFEGTTWVWKESPASFKQRLTAYQEKAREEGRQWQEQLVEKYQKEWESLGFEDSVCHEVRLEDYCSMFQSFSHTHYLKSYFSKDPSSQFISPNQTAAFLLESSAFQQKRSSRYES